MYEPLVKCALATKVLGLITVNVSIVLSITYLLVVKLSNLT